MITFTVHHNRDVVPFEPVGLNVLRQKYAFCNQTETVLHKHLVESIFLERELSGLPGDSTADHKQRVFELEHRGVRVQRVGARLGTGRSDKQ